MPMWGAPDGGMPIGLGAFGQGGGGGFWGGLGQLLANPRIQMMLLGAGAGAGQMGAPSQFKQGGLGSALGGALGGGLGGMFMHDRLADDQAQQDLINRFFGQNAGPQGRGGGMMGEPASELAGRLGTPAGLGAPGGMMSIDAARQRMMGGGGGGGMLGAPNMMGAGPGGPPIPMPNPMRGRPSVMTPSADVPMGPPAWSGGGGMLGAPNMMRRGLPGQGMGMWGMPSMGRLY